MCVYQISSFLGPGAAWKNANGHKVSFWGDENVLKLDCDDGCTTLKISFKTVNCTVHLKWVNFMDCKLYLYKVAFNKID